jgi:hypothetical protein
VQSQVAHPMVGREILVLTLPRNSCFDIATQQLVMRSRPKSAQIFGDNPEQYPIKIVAVLKLHNFHPAIE